MPSTDITYCIRNCGNMECERNKEHTKDAYVPLWFSDFKDCKEWRARV
jgi:hypothetical protein